MSKVIYKAFTTTVDLPVETVCEAAKNLKYVLIIGVDKDGDFYAACSSSDLAEALWSIEEFKQRVIVGKMMSNIDEVRV